MSSQDIDVVQRELDAQAVAHKRSFTWEVKEMEPIAEEEECGSPFRLVGL
jgi:hypothetical protein